jgi:KipI family sensor histidine kinase inhibitor
MDDPTAAFPRLRPLGDTAWIVEYGEVIDEPTHERVMGLAQALADARAQGRFSDVIEWVPAYTSVTLHFSAAGAADAAQESADALLALARSASPQARPGRCWRLPVCFEAEFAPDLAELAAACGLATDVVLGLMTSTAFRVYMLGFQPGFPYMGGLPAVLQRPRRNTPRTAVPERSLAVAAGMCAVYPWRSPGGWHLLGRMPLPLFDAANAEPAWLRPGDLVRWQAIDRSRFDELEHAAAAAAFRREAWLEAPGAAP